MGVGFPGNFCRVMYSKCRIHFSKVKLKSALNVMKKIDLFFCCGALH